MRLVRKLVIFSSVALSGCGATPGPDKAISGAILGAGWGAGAGAVIGNQFDNTGEGVAIGAGIGAVEGLITGAALDLEESTQLQNRRDIRALRSQVQLNDEQLYMLRDELNSRGRLLAENPSGLTVFFDPKLSSIRTGSAKELERLGQAIKFDYRVRSIKIIGHSDDTGSKEENEKLSVSRAKTIESFLIAQGISTDQITVEGVSSAEPVATNKSEAGRQLNRRVEIYLIR